jgi:hypothetical protein
VSARGRLRRLEEVGFHATFGTVYPCTDREAALLEGAGLVGAAEEHTERTDPRDQERRERWLFANRHGFEPWREKVRCVEEQQRAYAEASKQRDRELLEENRAAVGLPPLTLEQITKSGLEGTTRGEGGSRCPNARE